MKNSGKGPRLAEGPVGKAIVSMMVPIMFGMIAIVVNNVAGAFFVAKISTEQLAAITFTFPIAFMVSAVSIGLAVGTSSVVSRLFGGGNREDIRRVTLHAMLLGLAIGVVVLAIGLATIDPVFRLLGADETTLPLIHRYMKIYYWGGIFLVVPMVANSVLRASGDAKRPAMIMSAAALFNIAIDPILIFGLFGFPRMELEGAALGSVMSNALILFASAYFVIVRERLVDLKHPALDLLADSWRRILHVGIPSATSSLVAPITTAFITWQVAGYGQSAVAGFGVASRLEGLTMMALMALSAGMTPFVGQNFGAGKLERVRDGIRWAYRFSAIYGIAMAAVLAIGAPWIAAVFTDDPEARRTAVLHMRIVPLGYLALGMAMTVNGAMNALGKPLAAMFISLSRTALVYAPLAWVLSNLLGLHGIFIAAAVASVVAGGIGVAWFRLALTKKLQGAKPAEAL